MKFSQRCLWKWLSSEALSQIGSEAVKRIMSHAKARRTWISLWWCGKQNSRQLLCLWESKSKSKKQCWLSDVSYHQVWHKETLRPHRRLYVPQTEVRFTLLSAFSCLPVLGSHWTDFHRTLNFMIFRKSVEKFQLLSQSDKDKVYFTWRPVCTYEAISLSSSYNVKCYRQIYREKYKFFSPKILPFLGNVEE